MPKIIQLVKFKWGGELIKIKLIEEERSAY